MRLPHVEFPASMSCSDNREGGESSKEEKERETNISLDLDQVFTKHIQLIQPLNHSIQCRASESTTKETRYSTFLCEK
jgi:hypothetical protein